MSTKSPDQVSVKSPEGAFTSIAEMTAAHLELLKQTRTGAAGALAVDAVLKFLERGRQIGELLDRTDDRHNAQSLLDYWAASPTVLGASRSELYTPEIGLLAEFNEDSVGELQNRLNQWFETVPGDDKKLVNQLMLGLVRLDPANETFDRVPFSLERFPAGPERDKALSIIQSLRQIGAVQPEPADSQTDFILTHAALMRRTPRFRELLEQRLQFRRSSQIWEKSHRDRSMLLSTGRAIDHVQFYHDLSPLEQQFADTSRQVKLNIQRIWIGILIPLLILSVVLSAIAWSQSFWLKDKSERLIEESSRLEEERTRLKLTNEQLKSTNLTLQERTRELNEAGETLKSINQSLVKKQDLTIITTIARSLAGISASDDPAERDIARLRFRTLVSAYPDLSRTAAANRGAILEKISNETETEEERTALQIQLLNYGRRLKAEVLGSGENEEVKHYVSVERQIAFEIVRKCATEIVEAWEQGQTYQSANRFIVEFWTMYWADMAFVEQQKVESAMVAFGNRLKSIDDKVLSTIPDEVIKNLPLWNKRNQLSNRQITTQIRPEVEDELLKAHAEMVKSRSVDQDDVADLRNLLHDLNDALDSELGTHVNLQTPVNSKR